MSRPASRPANSPRAPKTIEDWRSKGGVAADSSSAKFWRRLLLTLLSGALLACLFWMLPQLMARQPRLQLKLLSVNDYAPLEAPQRLFLEQDLAALSGVVAPDVRTVPWSPSEKLAGYLKSGVNAVDVLLVYSTTHMTPGADEKQGPALLVTGYTADDIDGKGVLRLNDLLDAAAATTAASKLIVLDLGDFQVDGRRGLLLNDAARQAEKIVKAWRRPKGATSDEPIWILLSNEWYERPRQSLADRRSAFNYFFAAALAGQADLPGEDGNGDRKVSLGELTRYVHKHVSRWVWAISGERQTQTPLLIRTGQGRVEAASANRIVLTRVNKPPAEPADADKQDTAKAKANSDGSEAKPAEEPVVAKTETFAEQSLRQQQSQVDALVDDNSVAWRPCDAAPHRWNKYRKLLAATALRLIDAQDATSATGSQLEVVARELDEELRGLNGSIKSFAQSRAAASYEQDEDLARAVRQRNAALGEIRLWIAWSEMASAETSRNIAASLDQLRQCCAQWRELFAEEVSGVGAESTWAAAAGTRWRERAVQLGAQTQAARKALRDVFDAEVTRTGLARGETSAAWRAVELLRAGLCNARQRAELGGLIKSVKPTLGAALTIVGNAASPVEPQADAWRRALDCARLEVGYLGLFDGFADDAAIAELTSAFALAPVSPDDSTHGDAFTVLATLTGRLSAAIRQVSRQLVEQETETLRGGNVPWRLLRRLENASRLADPRDAQRLEEAIGPARGNPMNDAPLPIVVREVQLALGADGRSEIIVEVDAVAPVELRFRGKPALPAKAELRFDYDASQIDVLETFETKSALSADKRLVIDLQGARSSETRKFFVLAKGASGSETALSVRLADLPERQSYRVKIVAPQLPSVVVRTDHGDDSDASGVIRLPVFARGETEFSLLLKSLASKQGDGSARKVACRVLAVAEPTFDRAISGGLPWDSDLRVQWPHQEIAKGELTIKPDSEVALPNLTPRAAAPAAPGAIAIAPVIDVSGGLIVEVRDVNNPKNPGATRLTWLRPEARHPRDYLRVEAGFGRDGKKLAYADVSRQGAGPVAGSALRWSEPVPVEVAAANDKRLSITVDPAATTNAAQTLFAAVNTARDDLRMALDADGYPRAFIFRINRPTVGQQAALESDLREVFLQKIDLPPANSASAAQTIFPPRGDSVNAAVTALSAKRGSPIVVPVWTNEKPADSLTISVGCNVPTPDEGFLGIGLAAGLVSNSDDLLALAGGPVLKRSQHRRLQCEAVDLASGRLTVRAQVSDWTDLTLSTVAFRNQHAFLRCELAPPKDLGQDAPPLAASQTEILFDSQRPNISRIIARGAVGGAKPSSVGPAVYKADPLYVDITADDTASGSGVEWLELGDQWDDVKEDFIDKTRLRWRTETAKPNRMTAKFSTENIKLGDHVLYVRVKDAAGNWSTDHVDFSVVERPPDAGPAANKPKRYPGSIAGHVKRGGLAVKNATVFLLGETLREPVEVGEDGSFRFEGLTPGSYTVRIDGRWDGKKVRSETTVELKSRGKIDQDFELKK